MRALSLLAALALLWAPVVARADPSPSNTATFQASCTNAVTQIIGALPSALNIYTIETAGTAAVYIGPAVQPSGSPNSGSALSTSNGFQLPATAGASYTFSFAGPVSCISAGATTTLYVIYTTKGG